MAVFPDIEQAETQWSIYGATVMRSENVTIMDGVVSRYRVDPNVQVSASRDGVLVKVNWQLSTAEDIQTLHDVIETAWADALRFAREDRFGGRARSNDH